MRWSEYLASHPAEADALVNDLTMGYGGLAFMVRQLARDGELAAVLALLDRAERALDRAYRRLALSPEREELAAARPVALGQPWQAYLRARPNDGGAALLARLQDVVAQAQVAGEVLGADGSVDEVSIALRAALDQLRGLRLAMTQPS
jgi:hypothetical protein